MIQKILRWTVIVGAGLIVAILLMILLVSIAHFHLPLLVVIPVGYIVAILVRFRLLPFAVILLGLLAFFVIGTYFFQPNDYWLAGFASALAALAFFIYFIIRGRRHRWLKVSVYSIAGVLLATYLAMGVYCVVVLPGIPVPTFGMDVFTYGWEVRVDEDNAAKISFGYHGTQAYTWVLGISHLGILFDREEPGEQMPCQ